MKADGDIEKCIDDTAKAQNEENIKKSMEDTSNALEHSSRDKSLDDVNKVQLSLNN